MIGNQSVRATELYQQVGGARPEKRAVTVEVNELEWKKILGDEVGSISIEGLTT